MNKWFVLCFAAGVAGLAGLSPCGGGRTARPAPVHPQECDLLLSREERADSVTVALFDTVVPEYAPWGHNAGEDLLFHHLYETLTTVDCLGEVRAGLAQSWNVEDDGRRLRLELRENARFSDGSPVTARDVVNSWRDAVGLVPAIDSVAVADPRTLIVYLDRPDRGLLRALSAPAFAVAKPSAGSSWSLGSAPYRVASSESESSGAVGPGSPSIDLTTVDGTGTAIRFVQASAGDARDLLEGAVDLLITGDPAVVEYAAGRPQLDALELPWEVTYVLLPASRVQALRAGDTPPPIPSDLSDALARDAVRASARGHRPPLWWDDLEGCGDLTAGVQDTGGGPPLSPASSARRRVLYDLGDPVARDLAERIVALAHTDPAASPEAAAIASAIPGLGAGARAPVAEGVPRAAFDVSLRRADDFAYVLSVPYRTPLPCHEAGRLLGRAPWLVPLGEGFPKAFVPLVDARRYVIARRDCLGLRVDGFGRVRILQREPRRK